MNLEPSAFAPSMPVSEANLFQAFINASQDGFIAFDRDCKYIFWSKGMERISGLSQSQAIGRNAFELFPFLLEIGQDKIFERILRGESVSCEPAIFNVPQTLRTGLFSSQYFPLEDGGRVIGGFGIVTDVTDRSRAEALRKESESRFTNMASASPVMLWMSDKDSQRTFFNQSWLDFTGNGLDDEWGNGWATGIHQDDLQKCLDIYHSAFTARRSFELEYRLKRSDGLYRWILERGAPRYTSGAEFEGFIASCVDISERKKMEADLVEAIRVREDFISIASHELRTPLTALSLQVGVFEHMVNSNKSLSEAATRITPLMDVARRQIRHLSELIEKLLDLTRISAGKFALEKKSIDLVEVATEVQERYLGAAKQVGSAISLTGASAVCGNWDKSKLDQVLSNLISNSIKYAPGTPVNIAITKSGQTALLEVEDKGPGISLKYMTQIFDKFRRGTSDANLGGLGLGLFIVREIVHAHGGRIEVQNRPDHGAKFIVYLPM